MQVNHLKEWCFILFSGVQPNQQWASAVLTRAHPHAPRQSNHTQAHTVLSVSTDVRPLPLAYLHCEGPPSEGPSPAWWRTCGKPRGPAPSLPRPVGLSRGARWKTPHYQSGSDLPGKRGFQISAPFFLQTDGNFPGASNYSVSDQFKDFEKGWIWAMTQVDTIWGPPPTRALQRFWVAISPFCCTFPSALCCLFVQIIQSSDGAPTTICTKNSNSAFKFYNLF